MSSRLVIISHGNKHDGKVLLAEMVLAVSVNSIDRAETKKLPLVGAGAKRTINYAVTEPKLGSNF